MGFKYKKIAIPGGAGFVGSNLAVKLREHYPEIEIIALDNLKRRGSERNLDRLKSHDIEFKLADVRNEEDLQDVSCDLVIECSAEPSALAGVEDGLDYLIDTNFMGAVNCLEMARREQADFLFLSTSRVYPFDKINNLGFTETDTRFEVDDDQSCPGVSREGVREDFALDGPRTFYGSSKLAAEHLIREYQHFKGVKSVINRCGLITGPWQMGKVDQGVVMFWVAAHLLGKPLEYIGWGGKQVRDFVHIDDLFNLIDHQLNHFENYSGGVFNVGGGRDFSFSLLELTDMCAKVIPDSGVVFSRNEEVRQGDVKWYVSDTRKIREKSGWEPRKGLEETISEITAWAREHKNFFASLWQ